MTAISARQRLLSVLRREADNADRPPVICPGGMMNAAIVEVMEKTGHRLPEAHEDARLMADLATAVHQETGFENFGLPFCMTVEAEVLGSRVVLGSLTCEPKVEREAYQSVSDVVFKDVEDLVQAGRVRTVLDAIRRLSVTHPDIPVIGALTGPISTAASLVDPMTFYRELRKKPARSHEVLDYVTGFLGAFATLMIEHGASVIAIGDPSATGEILGPRLFEEYAMKYLNKIIDRAHSAGAPVIVHICGDLNSVKHLVPHLRSDAISTDAVVNLAKLKEQFPGLVTMGNVSTYLLEFGPAEKVAKTAKRLVRDGVDIIAPACGLSTSTSLEMITALTKVVKETLPDA
ncbi:MAG: methylcobalamin:coenzyme M methyltransferase [Syntrophorhabdaceae bacterium PtaU1.Bin034]|nr:MAG: methylcobalamin:coenzyme M methyltransferase [Syntrophorhabdaceae bacterium PtaU1.Bin034]